MELRHLRYFAAVAETGSFAKAAARLHITQPALSRQVRDLQEELACELFRRAGRGIALTAAGRVMLDGVRESLGTIEKVVLRTKSATAGGAPLLRLAHSCTLDNAYLATFLRDPRARFDVIEKRPGEALAALRDDAVDAIVAVRPHARWLRGFDRRLVWHIGPYAALPRSHRLARRRCVRLEDLRDAAWAVWDEERCPGYGDCFVEECRRAGFRPKIARLVESLGTIFAFVSAGEGVGYVASVARYVPHPGVALVELAWARERLPEVLLLWKRSSPHAPIWHDVGDRLAAAGGQRELR